MEKDETKLNLFVSFDIVGATEYKSKNSNWVDMIRDFYQNTYKQMEEFNIKEKIPNLFIWKHLGDEILIRIELNNNTLKKIEDIIYKIYEFMLKIDTELSRYDNALGVKGTIWISNIDTKMNSSDYRIEIDEYKLPTILTFAELHDFFTEIQEQSDKIDILKKFYLEYKRDDVSLYILYPEISDSDKLILAKIFDKDIYLLAKSQNEKMRIKEPSVINIDYGDFIGKRTDEGFRLSKYARRKLFTISAELGFILTYNNAVDDFIYSYGKDPKIRMLFPGFVKLKGIWDNMPYPLLWYYDKDKIDYDSTLLNNEIITKPLSFQESIFIKNVLKKNHLGENDEGSIWNYFKKNNLL